ncbi:cytochrome c oxidase subunit II transmembrane domain-containing protein [Candidatus Accumulibacter sp. ACC007]|uniref:cytochrome c oxidase subunit II transmembrane domain-containing protein n=1 Tax=Candidatus Accumulibacter sp. ACC007 TaxID=2823333 RepID=UPI0025C101E6|nr:cytochrome c oxidase subunit II transmembrane domain-containing protein [Candidatus Accumulibacter sp. ACC007]
MLHRFCQRTNVLWSGLFAAATPALARAESTADTAFAAAVGHEPLAMHGYVLVMLTVLFVMIFAITIYSMAKHRKGGGNQASTFSGPTGTVQWLWAMVPFAILLFVDYILISLHFAG